MGRDFFKAEKSAGPKQGYIDDFAELKERFLEEKASPEEFRAMWLNEWPHEEGATKRDDRADAAQYLSSYAHQTMTRAQMVELYTKFKDHLPPNIWKKISDEKLRVTADYSPGTDETVIAIMDPRKGELVETFRIADTELILSENKDMSNKFLPFIVESSTPLNIFKTLRQRSKGMNRVTVASIFNLTLNEDIKKLRDFAKSLPELPVENLYDEMMTKWPLYRVVDEELRLFEAILNFIPAQEDGEIWSTDMDEFDGKDIMMFFLVLSNCNRDTSEYSRIKWKEALQFDDVFEDLQKWIVLSDSGTPIHLESETELKAFIMYVAKLLPQIEDEPPPTYCLKFKSKGKKAKKS